MRIMPNQITAHRTASEAWSWAKMLIELYGEKVITEDRKMTKEIQNMHLCILEPLADWPISGSGWDLPALQEYTNKEILSPIAPDGFGYSYGQRLLAYPFYYDSGTCLKANQIEYIIKKMNKQSNSRRCVALTWLPDQDSRSDSVPCLQLIDFLIRGGKLNCTAFFRSWDAGRAMVPNMYGLAKLMEHVGIAVNVPIGSLTIMAASGHIYEA